MDAPNHRQASRTAAGALLVAALLAGCGGQQDSTPGGGYGAPAATTADEHGPDEHPQEEATDNGSAPAPQESVVVISDFTYALPQTIAPGAEVLVRNEDSVGHTVTSDDGVFDVVVPAGQQVAFTVPDEPGEYPFHCTPHPTMTGTLVVG